jgi:CRP/FNR family transcriptional regulator, cyclic AMP receptor protein
VRLEDRTGTDREIVADQHTGGWEELAALGTRRRYRRGETLFREGDVSETVMAVLEGRVKISVLTQSGREIVLSTKEPGELVGELAAVDGRRRSATATALGDVDVTTLSTSAFGALLDSEPARARQLLHALVAQLRAANLQRSERDEGSTLQRVARRLSSLARSFAEHNDPDAPVDLQLTQDDLAGWVGATREATNRALASLRATGCIATRHRRVVVTDPAALADLAHPGVASVITET